MAKTYIADIKDAKAIIDLTNTGLLESLKDTIYVMTNGKIAQIIHRDYKEELEAEGFWTATILENGHAVEI